MFAKEYLFQKVLLWLAKCNHVRTILSDVPAPISNKHPKTGAAKKGKLQTLVHNEADEQSELYCLEFCLVIHKIFKFAWGLNFDRTVVKIVKFWFKI